MKSQSALILYNEKNKDLIVGDVKDSQTPEWQAHNKNGIKWPASTHAYFSDIKKMSEEDALIELHKLGAKLLNMGFNKDRLELRLSVIDGFNIQTCEIY